MVLIGGSATSTELLAMDGGWIIVVMPMAFGCGSRSLIVAVVLHLESYMLHPFLIYLSVARNPSVLMVMPRQRL
jgi:predicted membrane channel-forming protein YqfA (hemolysin III family)